jgi:Mg-chelatase subunit ChlD
MSLRRLLPAALLLAATIASPTAQAAYREVEACFVLDTTGSMSSLISAAKEKIWFVANEIVQAPSTPRVRFCLLAYRDRGDEYVTQHTDLTQDIDTVYQKLAALTADGGGDTPEAVNQALAEAVDNTHWSTDADTLRLIFLVGDAPPSVYDGEAQYPEIAARAARKGILINPVLCGGDEQTRGVWQRIAETAKGETAEIADPGQVQRIVTPVDQDLAALNKRLGRTWVPYGDEAARLALADKQALSERMDDAGVADRLAFQTAAGTAVAGDLLDAIDTGTLDAAHISAEHLPEGMRSMTQTELLAHLQTVRAEREGLRHVIAKLVAQRKSLVDDRKRADAGGFDGVVTAMLARQMRRE